MKILGFRGRHWKTAKLKFCEKLILSSTMKLKCLKIWKFHSISKITHFGYWKHTNMGEIYKILPLWKNRLFARVAKIWILWLAMSWKSAWHKQAIPQKDIERVCAMCKIATYAFGLYLRRKLTIYVVVLIYWSKLNIWMMVLLHGWDR